MAVVVDGATFTKWPKAHVGIVFVHVPSGNRKYPTEHTAHLTPREAWQSSQLTGEPMLSDDDKNVRACN